MLRLVVYVFVFLTGVYFNYCCLLCNVLERYKKEDLKNKTNLGVWQIHQRKYLLGK